MIKKAAEFLKKIKETDELIVIYNNDGDGISSCVLLKKFLEKTGRKNPYIIAQPMPMDKNIVQRVKTTVPDKIIFVDMAADQQQSLLRQLAGICEILIIDHHQIARNMNSKRIVHYNPRIDDPRLYQSASYCTYKICSKITDMSDVLWVAGVGMVSDYNLEDSKDLAEGIRKRYNLKGELYKTKFGRIADMISSTSATKLLSYDQMVEIFNKADGMENFEKTENADKMVESYRVIKSEMEHLINDSKTNTEKIGKIILYEIKSEYGLSSPLSTRMSEKFPKELVIVYHASGNRMKMSARNQAKNINAGKVLEKAAKEVNGSGGGHEAAAGATISVDDWDRFKEVLDKIVNK